MQGYRIVSQLTFLHLNLVFDQDPLLKKISAVKNTNGILGFCNQLLQSIDKNHLEKTDTYDFPDAFWDHSDIALSIRIEEGNKSTQQVKLSFMEQAGCFLAIAAFAVVVIVGIVTSFGWLVKVLN